MGTARPGAFRGDAGCLARMSRSLCGPNDIRKRDDPPVFWMLWCARSSPSYGLTNDRSSPFLDEENPSLPALFA